MPIPPVVFLERRCRGGVGAVGDWVDDNCARALGRHRFVEREDEAAVVGDDRRGLLGDIVEAADVSGAIDDERGAMFREKRSRLRDVSQIDPFFPTG